MPRLKNPFSDVSNPTPTIESTRRLATFLHKDQTVASGAPYILHPIRVAQNLQKIKDLLPDDKKHLITEKVVMAALLHDVMEDCYSDEAQTRKVNEEDFRGWGYDEETIKIVRLVTKPEGVNLSYDQKTDLLISSGNLAAMCVKLADNMDNSHPIRQSRLSRKQPERAARLTANYSNSIERLAGALEIDPQLIFKQIEEKYQPLGVNAADMIIEL